MSKLNEYIGGIVSSITNARAMCDMQTVEIARQYSGHDLLKHFSVPRMRIEDIEMTIPVAMDVQDIGNNEGEVKPEKIIDAVINTGLDYVGIRFLSTDDSNELRRMTTIEAEVLTNPKDANSETTKAFSERMANYFWNLAKRAGIHTDEIRIEILGEKLSEAVRTAANNTTVLGNMNVIIEAVQLREVPRENLIYIKMKIREDGMEWSVAENNDGTIESKLLPE